MAPDAWGAGGASPRGADRGDDDGRERPAVGDALLEDLREELVRDEAREGGDALAGADGRLVLSLLYAELGDFGEEGGDAGVDGAYGEFMAADLGVGSEDGFW